MAMLTGIMFLVAGISLCILFEVFIVGPYGSHGEISGPVKYFRWPIDMLCVAVAFVGVMIMVVWSR